MTNPVSGGVPEQGLRDKLLDFEEAVRLHESSEPDTHEWQQAGSAVAFRREKLLAALERPRPALPAPEPQEGT